LKWKRNNKCVGLQLFASVAAGNRSARMSAAVRRITDFQVTINEVSEAGGMMPG
jgi:hypothetical protein